MSAGVTANSILFFKDLTKYDLSKYFDDVEEFFKTGYRDISDFYNGRINNLQTASVSELYRLRKEANKVNDQFKHNKGKFKTVDFWELLDFCEGIRGKLETTLNLDRFLRSSRTGFNFSPGFAHPYTMANQQTLEDISNNIMKDNAPDDDWVKIALQNDLQEKDWSIKGGKNITLFREKFLQNFVTSVIDNMFGEKIYGLDLQRKLEYADDDLVVLTYKDTARQTVQILSHLKMGDIPEFPGLGVQSKLYVGSNLAGLSYSSVVRDMKKVFSTDDLFINFKVKEIKQNQDSFSVEFSVDTKYKLLIETIAVI